MPAKSKAQQRFMGMVHALQKGETKPSDVSDKVKKAADSMSDKDTEDYVKTKHKGLPNKVKKENLIKLIKSYLKQESLKESGIMYRAGVKKYGKEGMTKIQQAAGKGLGHEEIGKIKDKYDKTKKETAEVTEDTKDIAKAKQISRQLEKIESKYRKAMYDLSDRLQADPKNHKLQDELIKSYTKHVTSFMKDMVKITKRVK